MQRQATLALERLACQRQAAAQYKNHHIDGPRPQPGQPLHSAFELAAQKTPPPSVREPGPAAQVTAAACRHVMCLCERHVFEVWCVFELSDVTLSVSAACVLKVLDAYAVFGDGWREREPQRQPG